MCCAYGFTVMQSGSLFALSHRMYLYGLCFAVYRREPPARVTNAETSQEDQYYDCRKSQCWQVQLHQLVSGFRLSVKVDS